MKRLQAYKFQLKTRAGMEFQMRQFAGSCRFVWNRAFALQQERYQADGTRIRYNDLAGLLVEWKKDSGTSFLSTVYSQILQQTLKDLERAWINFFQKRAERPQFKKKGRKESFRFPQGFKLDQVNSRIYLPKLGWIRYRNSRQVEGTPKQVTVSKELDRWFISVQTEREVVTPKHPATSDIGIDMGIKTFAAVSDGMMIQPIQSFKTYSQKLARIQRKLSHKQKGSSNWKRVKTLVSKTHQKIGRIRQDFLHKTSTHLSKNHALIFVEDLKVRNMSASAKGTVDQPGRNLKAKAGINRSILDQGWFKFRRQLEY
jgi:putative transposase